MKKIFLCLPMQSTFSIPTNSETLIHLLKLKYGKYLVEEAFDADYSIDIIQNENQYNFSSELYSGITTSPLSELDRYIFDHTTYDDKVFALHGGVVEWQQNAYLFLAPTTSGKTTLTSYLTSRGCGYLTDDCILLGRADFTIHPCSTPIQLRDGGAEVLKRYQALPTDLQLLEEGTTFRRWVYTPKNCIEKAISLKRIFFIERTENENALVYMNTTERITALMKSPITNYQVNGDYLRFLSRLAKADCHILRYCDMNFVKELIQNG